MRELSIGNKGNEFLRVSQMSGVQSACIHLLTTAAPVAAEQDFLDHFIQQIQDHQHRLSRY